MNYYNLYSTLDSFMRCDKRLFNLMKPVPTIIRCMLEGSSIDLPESAKCSISEDVIIISSDKICAREYIMYNGNKCIVLIIPESIREDEFSIIEKIKTLFKLTRETFSVSNLYNMQKSLIPFLITTTILSDMYAPFKDLAKTIVDTLIDSDKFNDDEITDILSMMDYINNSSNTDLSRYNIFSNSAILSIIDRKLAIKIISNYKKEQ